MSVVSELLNRRRERRLARAAKFMDDLKARYHTFRILLANNEYSLDLMRSVEQSLKSGSSDLPEVTEELLSVTYELVDGLNQLSDDRHARLYETYHNLADAIQEELDTLMTAESRTTACVFLDDLTNDLRGEVGGKAVNLALLRKAGFPVPNGFAVTSVACRAVLASNGLDDFIRQKAQKLEAGYHRGADFEGDTEEIGRRILDAVFPEEFEKELSAAWQSLASSYPEGRGRAAISVRSSALVEDRAEHSFAGQFKSVLNVVSFEGLKNALKEVIAGNYSSRSIAYRLHAGLPPARHDMAVLCQLMVPARSAGIVFTVDPATPENGRMLISAVPGLGIAAVGGSAPADIYRPARKPTDTERVGDQAQIAAKTHRVDAKSEGGIEEIELPETERNQPVLSEELIRSLVRLGRRIESLIGKPQDIEWAVSTGGEIHVLQSRDIRLSLKNRQAAEIARGELLLRGGVCASPGRSIGKVKVVHSTRDFEAWRKNSGREPRILVLRQSLSDAAAFMSDFEGVVVDLGNPADHLAVVAREYSRPMMTGAGKAVQTLQDGQWIVLDADMGMIFKAPEDAWTEESKPGEPSRRVRGESANAQPEPLSHSPRLKQLILPLNLTDAYGPSFSIRECRSIHDLIRYAHEMAVLAMFQTGDEFLESAEVLVRRLEGTAPLHFLMIDLGGGIAPDSKKFKVRLEDVFSVPLLALWRGIMTPGLRWNQPPPGAMPTGLLSRSLLDSASARPIGQQNYALITRDYLNLNARVDYHFAMVDAVCGMNPRENHIRFRFKGGGTTAVQRERRAQFITEVLQGNGFFVDQRGDLVTASILETQQPETEERLVMLGRLLGFSRQLDATMRDDTVAGKVARAFLDGDYALKTLCDEA
ncbi:MAG: PEP/pyruvate-binding domain-containing protein [Syntrophobacteraceae bacterium]